MGEAFSQLGSPREDEHKCLLFPRLATTGCHASSTRWSPCSCVPAGGVVGGSCVTCPTCQGSGRIPQELEKQLVALIPYGDQRLKSRHTELFVSLAVLLCLAATSLITFFLFPRSLAVHPASLNSSVAFDKGDVLLNATSVLDIYNPNYWSVTVTQLAIQVLHLSLIVGQLSQSPLLRVGPLAREQLLYTVASRIQDQSTHKICTCLEIRVHHVLLRIQGTLTYSCLGRTEERVFESFEYVNCRGKVPPHRRPGHQPPHSPHARVEGTTAAVL